MHHPKPLAKSASTTEISNIQPQVVRAPTPSLDDRFPYSFKSLFTLADVAAKRRANGSIKKLMIKTDENTLAGGGSALLKRSKSSGDVAVLGEKPRALNAISDVDAASAVKPAKVLRSRAATTPSAPPSKIPKAKSPTWLNAVNASLATLEDDSSPSVDSHEPKALKVDDALFVMVTPPKAAKNLTLAAHTVSLPKVASPFSPRISQPSLPRQTSPRFSPTSSRVSGHTNASLHLTKSHWELRYEVWLRSLRVRRRPNSARAFERPADELLADERTPRSRFPEPLTNPALFPRAGSLTPRALRPLLDGTIVEDDARPAIELDWAMRAWPLDKIQRALFVHDMDVRAWFPDASESEGDAAGEKVVNSEMEVIRGGSELKAEEVLRRWEWDWEMRWRVIEDLARDDDEDRAECEYDVFLSEEGVDENAAYAGCEVEEHAGKVVMEEEEWEWSEEAMEVDEIL